MTNKNRQIDRIVLSYNDDSDGQNRDVTLPFRLLVIGNFSGVEESHEKDQLYPTTVTQTNVDTLLQQCDIQIQQLLPLADLRIEIDYKIGSFNDFLPQNLLQNIEPLQQISIYCQQLEVGEPLQLDNTEAWLLQLLEQCGVVSEEPLPALISVSLLRAIVQQGLNAVLHYPRFQQLERLWRDLITILMEADEQSCSIDMLDITFQQLLDDCGSNRNIKDTQLYHLLYNIEYGQYGGIPYSTAILGFAFNARKYQVKLLQNLSKIGNQCHMPFIAQAAPEFFHIDSYRELANISGISELHQSPGYIYWRSFQQQESSRYIALTLPGVLRRLPYRAEQGNRLYFDEKIAANGQNMLWGSAAFDYAACLLRSVRLFGSAIDAVGSSGGRVTMPAHLQREERYTPLLEINLTEKREAELANLGFMPLTLDASGKFATFFSAHSVQWGALQHLQGEPRELLDMRLGAQITYLLVVTRVAHYLKVIQRERLGTISTANEIANELNHWLQQYVSDLENPAPAVRARRPFRQAEVQIIQNSDNHWHQMELQLVPHMHYLGARFSLNIHGGF